jgi:two-component system cell cycle response regulator
MTPHAIALVGFTSFEYSAFESFFRLARRQPGFRIVDDLNAAALILANADDLDVMRDLVAVAPRQHVLLVGASGHGTAWPVQPRPIKLMSVLTAMEQLLSPAPAAAASQGTGAPRRRAAAKPADEEPTQPMATDDGILVVDDSETALHFMQNRLRRFGFTAELVSSGEEAIKRIAQRPYKFVFLDVTMEGMDGYQACRTIKQRYYPDGKPPVVVMLTSRTGTIDKAKGKLAGCDAWLAKPLTERDLATVLTKFDMEIQRSFQPTRLDRGR